MAKFKVSSFYDVPVSTYRSGGKHIDMKALKRAAAEDEELHGLLSKNGVYVFSIRAGKGRLPWYVGKSEKATFLREAFNNRNRLALQEVINSRKGILEISFVTQMVTRGKPNTRNIAEIEYLLIGHAAERNSNLINIQNTNQNDDFSIQNVYNSGKGKPSENEKKFKSLLGL